MKFAEEKAMNDRPHPNPLAQERGNHTPSHEITCDWIGRTTSGKKQTVRSLLPLPGGEGRGEGGRNN